MELLWLAAALPALLAIIFLIMALVAFFKGRTGGGILQVVVSVLLLAVAGLFGLVAVGMNGYRALTAERTAATVEIDQEGEQRFSAHFTFPDGEEATYQLAGDQLYVDARILKWHPRANLLGLSTGYQLDRVAGRYRNLDDEQTSPRTVYSLADEGPVDLFDLARRYEFVSRLVDAEYGSATFLEISDGGTYQVRVSNSGLLIREVTSDR
ncbi:MAG TPA: hypothetical protein VF168_09335 [Trueperaceae bacterium]